MKLLDTITTNTTGSSFDLKDVSRNLTGTVSYTVACFGTFNGATVKLQVSPDNTNWIDAYSFTTQEGIIYDGGFRYARGVLSSAGASTSLTLELT
jgi:hypothetical protein